jgi:hypothetical protein
MTELLKQLLHEFGLLYVTMGTLEEARKSWSESVGPIMSDEQLLETPVADDEPVVVFKVGSHQDIDKHTGTPGKGLKVFVLPEDEFYFFTAFRDGMQDLSTELPGFLFGMCLAHAYGLFEHYLTNLLKSIFLARPEMLGKSKTLNYGEILDSSSMTSLLDRMTEKELLELFHKSLRDVLKALREKYGFKHLESDLDDKAVEFSLIRNCLAHHHGIVDLRLEAETRGSYKRDSQIVIDRELVVNAITTFRKLALAVDKVAEDAHFKRLDD